MANRSSRANEGLSESHPDFRNRRGTGSRNPTQPGWDGDPTISINRPRIFISLDRPDARFMPGEVLIVQYHIELPPDKLANAVESSVLWTTTGKGEEDFGVHFFERRPKQTLNSEQLRQPHRISTVLPRSPMSYEGAIVQVRWSVRLRVFFEKQQFTEDLLFQLGQTSLEDYETIEG